MLTMRGYPSPTHNSIQYNITCIAQAAKCEPGLVNFNITYTLSLPIMTQDSLTYSIPMKGQGSYNLHSELQRHVLVKALHLLRKATDRASRNPSSPNPDLLTVVEYGASHGSNSYVHSLRS